MEEILHQLIGIACPIIYRVLSIGGGAGFQTSTVSLHLYNEVGMTESSFVF